MEVGKFSFKFSRQAQKNLVGSSKCGGVGGVEGCGGCGGVGVWGVWGV
jgi:hypothetical protein